MKLLVRPASTGDIPALTRFAAAHNADPRQRCLFFGETIPEIESDLEERFEGAPEKGFVLAENGDGIAGVMGCAVDSSTLRGWLAGPWVASAAYEETAAALFAALRAQLGRRVALFDTFVDAEAARVIRFYTDQGFRARKRAHVYTAPRPANAASLPTGTDLASADEPAFLDLHARTFPEAPDPGADLLDRRGESFRILTVRDSEGLVGYACGAEQREPREGLVEYLAVEPRGRGCGHGRVLLAQMLRWFFVEKDLPQAALAVDDDNSGARDLYESAGFQVHRTGVALRWPLCG
jgi:ribosomal protein S18 acetylase RimI-like enzyme